ncbi:hypothetical protein APHWEB_1207 [Anaplasma phagocytophilum str. Webster]|nr:hypothetical protein APHWEB_1207 [Anaplasma phagocytophilum str. Webster]
MQVLPIREKNIPVSMLNALHIFGVIGKLWGEEISKITKRLCPDCTSIH